MTLIRKVSKWIKTVYADIVKLFEKIMDEQTDAYIDKKLSKCVVIGKEVIIHNLPSPIW